MVFLGYVRSVASQSLSFSPAAYPIRGARETSREGRSLGWEPVMWGRALTQRKKHVEYPYVFEGLYSSPIADRGF